jgi:hypothetical protein
MTTTLYAGQQLTGGGHCTQHHQHQVRAKFLSGMFFPEPGSDFFLSRMPDLGSKFFSTCIPDPHQRILSILPKNMFFYDPDPDFLPIPDPGSRGQKGTGSRIQIRNTG